MGARPFIRRTVVVDPLGGQTPVPAGHAHVDVRDTASRNIQQPCGLLRRGQPRYVEDS
ncbi:hypothetical protein E143388_08099 [Rhodococcus opacus]|nr:hypothetical protein E143388_08099 [Rhodococcus opacus]